MQLKWFLAAFAAVLITSTPWAAQAFECPKHIEAAEEPGVGHRVDVVSD